jgi:hypothetical protein
VAAGVQRDQRNGAATGALRVCEAIRQRLE